MGSDGVEPGFVTVLYVGNDRVGEVRVRPPHQQPQRQTERLAEPYQSQPPYASSPYPSPQHFFSSEIRASGLSQASERCLPLMVLHTISLDGMWFKMEATTANRDTDCDANHDSDASVHVDKSDLDALHATCLSDAKTVVVPMSDGVNELHLVAMKGKVPCFWAFTVQRGLYSSCLGMLNLRCLAMVFDLDETLILANTQRSFEDRIEALKVKIHLEKLKMGKMDGQRIASMVAELERYQEDRLLLKQFADNDFVIVDNGRVIRAQLEEVRPPFEGGQPIWRPVIRIPERNLIFTRIHPNVRDTSILVKLRPAWEELRNYVIARGRKRFEVFICTMSEKDYALEMWRLLDPDARLIDSKQLLGRLLCVKAGSKKSLANMFQYVQCHPRMAIIIDDRPDVWEDKDQQHVHAVPAFSPYYAPGAETNAQLPILCVAKNVASNVRGGFFKDFDETLLQKFSEVDFDTDASTLPCTPHVGTYLAEMVPNENTFTPSLNNSPKAFPDGISGGEVKNAMNPQPNPSLLNTQPYNPRLPNLEQMNLDSSTRSTLGTTFSPGGGWLEDDDDVSYESAFVEPTSNPHQHIVNGNSPSLDQFGDMRQQQNNPTSSWFTAQDSSKTEEKATKWRQPEESVHVRGLQELAQKCNASVEYRCLVNATTELLFTYEVHFEGNRVGQGVARTSREAKVLAAEDALRFLERAQSSRFPSRAPPTPFREISRSHSWNSRGRESQSPGALGGQDDMSIASTSGRNEGDERKVASFNAIAALKTLCTIEGFEVAYLERPTSSGTFICEVEVSGRILGKGSGIDLESAKQQAAEQAIRQLTGNANSNTDTNTRNKRNLAVKIPSFNGKRAKSGEPWRPPMPSGRGQNHRASSRHWARTPAFRR